MGVLVSTVSMSWAKEGLNFRNETTITYEAKSYSVFIQTDKAIYKPGQLVHLRAIVVNPSLLPSVTGSINIHVVVSHLIFESVPRLS